jgi:hypothetical protein
MHKRKCNYDFYFKTFINFFSYGYIRKKQQQ